MRNQLSLLISELIRQLVERGNLGLLFSDKMLNAGGGVVSLGCCGVGCYGDMLGNHGFGHYNFGCCSGFASSFSLGLNLSLSINA